MRRDASNLIVLDTDEGEYLFHADVETDDEGNRVPVLRLTLEPKATVLDPESPLKAIADDIDAGTFRGVPS